METALKIRRLHQVDGQSISAIAKVTGLSRNTVHKYLRQPDPAQRIRADTDLNN